MIFKNLIITAILVTFFINCTEKKSITKEEKQPTTISEENTTPVFSMLTPQESGINFTNYNKENNDYNYYAYEYFYNGGGVATADFNNDGLLDIVFTANMAPNKLFINKGNLSFEDVTQNAGINSNTQDWCTGVTVVDINNDGYQDIFISRSGWFENNQEEKLSNLLFINNKDLTFTEKSAEYGFTDLSRSNQACFFDLDNDGDLDMYLINNPKEHTKTREYKDGSIKLVDVGSTYQDSDKLYLNTNGKFVDVTKKAGLTNADYGLGIVAADLNNDGYQDLYIANDYSKPDAVLINNKKGGFNNTTKTALKHMSKFSMGVDIADINNDGLLDIFNSEMLGQDNYSKKVNMASMNPKLYWGFVNSGYHYQDMHNSLQINNGNNTFSEIAWMANVAETDWSWCPLIADFDNDGNKDIFVTNGIKREVFNKDFMGNQGKGLSDNPQLFESAISFLPSQKPYNAMFKNNGDLTFTDSAMDWGLKAQAFNSNGAAYADFDNDGDLDLVVNNIEDNAAFYKNNSADKNNAITLTITKNGKIPYGTKASLLKNNKEHVSQITNTRGFQSVSDHRIHFGLEKATKADSIIITWPNNKKSVHLNLAANKNHEINYKDATFINYSKNLGTHLFKDVSNSIGGIQKHQEKEFDDYKTEILLPQKQSQEGPFVAVADVNGDDLDDFFQGNGAGYPGTLYLQSKNGSFKKGNQTPFIADKDAEDIGVLFFDYDADGDQDLYVVSGSNEHVLEAPQMQDRLYENDGSGNFSKTKNKIPNDNASGSCVIANDIDNDGDIDLFIGGYQTPQQYPKAGKSLLLLNNNGIFTNEIATIAPALENIGMVKDAAIEDINNDGKKDIIVVGHWMPVSIFESNGNTYTNTTNSYGISDNVGWWNSIELADLDGNGTKDFILGNLGLNSKHKANLGQPFKILAKDFDNNGTNDIALGYYNNNSLYPVRGLQCSAEQNPDLKQSIRSYAEFGNLTFNEVYSKYDLSDAISLEATYFQSAIYYNNKTSFTIKALPNENQVAPTNSSLTITINGKKKIITVGNLHPVEVETGRYDAHTGTVLESNGGNISNASNTGLFNDKDARDIDLITINGKKHIMVANNREQISFFKIL